MQLEAIVVSVFYGVMVGGVYALISMGLALIWGVMDVINLAHGELIVLGGYIAYWAFVLKGIHPLLSIPVSAIIVGGVGFLIQKFLVARVRGGPPLNSLILTYGVGIFMANAMLQAWTADYRRVNVPLFIESLTIGPLKVSKGDFVTFVVSLSLVLSVHMLLSRTYLGKAIRAVAQDRHAAQLMGIDDKKIDGIAFLLGSMLAGAAGPLFVALYYVYPALTGWLTAKSFILTVLSGVGSMSGVIAGGILLGVMESITVTLTTASYRELIGFIAFIVVLLAKPSGLFGKIAQ